MERRPRSQWAHSGGPADTVIADQVTSNVAESTMSQVGGQNRKEAPPDLMRRILDADAQRYATRAKLGTDGDKWTPFAAKTFEDQREKSKGLLPAATGNGFYNVVNSTIATQTTRGNRVLLIFGGPGEDNQWTCTCNFPARFRIPCCDMIAVAREEDKMDEVMNLMHPAYRIQHYRETYNNDAFRILLPVPSMLEADTTLVPPAEVDGRAEEVQENRGAREQKRIFCVQHPPAAKPRAHPHPHPSRDDLAHAGWRFTVAGRSFAVAGRSFAVAGGGGVCPTSCRLRS